VNEFQLPSEEQVESFLRGESDLEFRSLTDINIDGARYVKRKINNEEVEFLAVKGIATTAAIDDNGVEVIPDALKSLPADFKRRNTLLFNHNPDFPIGTIGQAKFVNGANGRKLSRPARVDVNPVLIDTEARLPTGQRVVTAVERGTLSKFSFAWSTRDGIIVFGPRKSVDDEEIEALGLEAKDSFAFRIGSDSAPQIRVNSLVGVELSVVSVPADAAAEFGARFQRNLDTAIERHMDSRNGIFVPESYQEDDDGRILVPVSGFRALAAEEAADEEREVETEVEEPEGEVLEAERNAITIVIDSDVITERILQTIEERVMARLEPAPEDDGERDIETETEDQSVEPLKGIVAFSETGLIDRIWSPADVEARVADWARGDNETLDLEMEEDQARYASAFVGFRGDGLAQEDYFLLHHDVVDGELVSNLRGVKDAAGRLADTDFGEDSEERIDAAVRHLAAEYEAHGEEVPEALREDSTEDDEE
jgi:hypothetical protein